MCNLSVLYTCCLSLAPSWTFPKFAHLKWCNLSSLTVSQLQSVTQCVSSKLLLLNLVLHNFDNVLPTFPDGLNKYCLICGLYYHECNKVVYPCFIHSLTCNAVQDPHVFTTIDFSLFLKNAFISCSSHDKDTLLLALNANINTWNGSLLYHLKSSSSKDILRSNNVAVFLCKVFQDQFLNLYKMSNETLIETYLSENWCCADTRPFFDVCNDTPIFGLDLEE